MPEARKDDTFTRFLLSVCIIMFAGAGVGAWSLSGRVTAIEVQMNHLREGQADLKAAVKANANEIAALRRDLDHR